MAARSEQRTMRAMVFEGVGRPLRAVERPIPTPGPGQLLLRVHACGVCRTDLHLLDGEVRIARPPRILGHQIVGEVLARGGTAEEAPARGANADEGAASAAAGSREGARVGVPWLGWTCGRCEYCASGRENLCPRARFTGCDIDGGMAEYTVADARYCFALPPAMSSEQVAPLLCAGLIGYRALRMCGPARRIGLYGFGAAAHILVQVCRRQGRRVYAFTRAGDDSAQALARELGAVWVGASEQEPPEPLEAAIVFAPVGALVPLALRALAPGGTVVCGGIHMSDIPSFPYSVLWEERAVRSVANLTRADAEEMLALAPTVPVRTHVTTYPLGDAGRALEDLRAGRFAGAAVIVP
jgi:alcohol dehydrogenase, propanol-preferring